MPILDALVRDRTTMNIVYFTKLPISPIWHQTKPQISIRPKRWSNSVSKCMRSRDYSQTYLAALGVGREVIVTGIPAQLAEWDHGEP